MDVGVPLSIMAARRFDQETGEQEPYEYTDVGNFEQLTVNVNALYYRPSYECYIVFKTGMYRRADRMVPLKAVTINEDDKIFTVVLGRDGDQASGLHLGKWLCVQWEGGTDNEAVIEIKAVGR